MSGKFPFVDTRISNQQHPAGRSRAMLATRVGLCSCVFGGLKLAILYIKRVGSFLHVEGIS